mmetsp:Transcript_48257/g.102622  ORF Transcript_48257/g.102622 Transcript_48257/m.102622 type:complete len:88 (+) Transcript_48257:433-696(+)
MYAGEDAHTEEDNAYAREEVATLRRKQSKDAHPMVVAVVAMDLAFMCLLSFLLLVVVVVLTELLGSSSFCSCSAWAVPAPLDCYETG